MNSGSGVEAAKGVGPSESVAIYRVSDGDLAAGSTLGGPQVCAVIKATGALEKVYSIALGETLFGTLVLHHWDEQTGMPLAPTHMGTFTIHPEHQERAFSLANDVAVHEDIFVLSGKPGDDGSVDPPAVYYTVSLTNQSGEDAHISTYAFCELRGQTAQDVVTTFDKRLSAFVAWNESAPDHARVFGCSEKPTSYEATLDRARAVAESWPGPLSNKTDTPPGEPLGAMQLSHALAPGEAVSFYFLLSFCGEGRDEAVKTYRSCPDAGAALQRTTAYYHDVLDRAVVMTPNESVNRGVLWAKANMLRIMLKSPTGWCFVNDPSRSNNSVARDTAWFGFGGDYLDPRFVHDSLLAYVDRQEPSGMIVEYYDIRNGETADYGLNINDNTPLLCLALWHHYNATGDEEFLRKVYPAAVKAVRYILSQRNDQGLVWCTATGTSDWGIIGWRNVIKNYRLSGATTEVNSECYAALRTVSHMARKLGHHDESAELAGEADALREAINKHLFNPDNGLYYLNIDLDGHPRSDVTSDLVFPVIFGAADDATAARIVSRLSQPDFWTEGGIRTAPRDSPTYTPDGGYGLLGGVWVAVTFWYAFAAARYNPSFMDDALGTSFQNYSRNPRQNLTVPGQFSEWLHGETLVNEGMMLSPWFPPRYLWAAIEGMAGFDFSDDDVVAHPHLAAEWKWMGVRNLPYRGERLSWLAVRAPDVQMYTNYHFKESQPYLQYDEDVTPQVHARGDSVVATGFRQGTNYLLFVGNTDGNATTTAVYLDADLAGMYRVRTFDSLLNYWSEGELVPAERLRSGVTVQIERRGFWLLEVKQEM